MSKTREERRRTRKDVTLIGVVLAIMVGAAFAAEWVAPSLI